MVWLLERRWLLLHAAIFFLINIVAGIIFPKYNSLLNFHRMILIRFPSDDTNLIWLVLPEQWMWVYLFVAHSLLCLLKIIHIKLPNERWEIIVSEIDWEDLLDELDLVFYFELFAIVCPGNDVVKIISFKNLEDFDQESCGIVSLSFILRWLIWVTIILRIEAHNYKLIKVI